MLIVRSLEDARNTDIMYISHSLRVVDREDRKAWWVRRRRVGRSPESRQGGGRGRRSARTLGDRATATLADGAVFSTLLTWVVSPGCPLKTLQCPAITREFKHSR